MTTPPTPDAGVTRFTLIWRDGGYHVSEPNIGTMEVVSAAAYDAVTAQLAAAKALMTEAADDIEYMVNAEYHGPDDVHPAMRAKYKRDIEIVGHLRDAARTGAR